MIEKKTVEICYWCEEKLATQECIRCLEQICVECESSGIPNMCKPCHETYMWDNGGNS